MVDTTMQEEYRPESNTPQCYCGTNEYKIIRLFALWLGNGTKRISLNYQTQLGMLEINILGWIKYLFLKPKFWFNKKRKLQGIIDKRDAQRLIQ